MPEDAPEVVPVIGDWACRERHQSLPQSCKLGVCRGGKGVGGGRNHLHLENAGEPSKEMYDSQETSKSDLRSMGI